MTKVDFKKRFGNIPVFGMLHLAGESPVARALDEIAIFEQEGLSGVIVENYHGSIGSVVETLREVSRNKPKLAVGVNVLPNEFGAAFHLARLYGCAFIQLDFVAGKYVGGSFDSDKYVSAKRESPDVFVFGGVWPKYYTPVLGSDLVADLRCGMSRAEAVVVTGYGTGMPTSIDKIKQFRAVLGEHPLVVGAGLTPSNAFEQLCVADGAIVGSCLKIDSRPENLVDVFRVREFMRVVNDARTYRDSHHNV